MQNVTFFSKNQSKPLRQRPWHSASWVNESSSYRFCDSPGLWAGSRLTPSCLSSFQFLYLDFYFALLQDHLCFLQDPKRKKQHLTHTLGLRAPQEASAFSVEEGELLREEPEGRSTGRHCGDGWLGGRTWQRRKVMCQDKQENGNEGTMRGLGRWFSGQSTCYTTVRITVLDS